MEQTNFPISRDLSLKQLTADALVEIERLGYSRRSRNRYRAIWEHLIEFSDLNELADDFSGDLAMRFLEEYRVGDEKKETPGQSWRKHLVWGVSVLADFAETGRIERGFADVEAIHLIQPCRIHCVTTFSIVRIAFNFDRELFVGVLKNSRSS